MAAMLFRKTDIPDKGQIRFSVRRHRVHRPTWPCLSASGRALCVLVQPVKKRLDASAKDEPRSSDAWR